MDEQLLDIVLSNTYTKTDLYRRLSIAREFFEHFFYDTNDVSDVKNKSRRKRFADYAQEHKTPKDVAGAVGEWGDAFFNAFSADSFYDAITKLTQSAEALPELTLYVPVALRSEHISRIGAQVREHVGGQVLLDVKVDRVAAGGCMIAWQGVYHDFSLSYFLKKRQRDITALVHSYGSQ